MKHLILSAFIKPFCPHQSIQCICIFIYTFKLGQISLSNLRLFANQLIKNIVYLVPQTWGHVQILKCEIHFVLKLKNFFLSLYSSMQYQDCIKLPQTTVSSLPKIIINCHFLSAQTLTLSGQKCLRFSFSKGDFCILMYFASS